MRLRIEALALGLVVVAVVPYIALKMLWLSGSTIGTRDDAVVAELHSTRMVIGNNITIGLELLAVGLALALTSAWGRRVRAWIILGLGGGATGLLAPILLGLPLGSALQLAVEADVHTQGMDHLSPWVFATVYGGFGVMALGILVLAWRYATTRWADVMARSPDRPPAWVAIIGAAGLVPFGVAMVWWGLLGVGGAGPQAMDAPVQRTTLAVTGLLALAGFLAPAVPGIGGRAPRLTWLVVWVGCSTAALQASTQVLLANAGHPTPALLLLGLLTVPATSTYGLLLLRGRLADGDERRANATARATS